MRTNTSRSPRDADLHHEPGRVNRHRVVPGLPMVITKPDAAFIFGTFLNTLPGLTGWRRRLRCDFSCQDERLNSVVKTACDPPQRNGFMNEGLQFVTNRYSGKQLHTYCT